VAVGPGTLVARAERVESLEAAGWTDPAVWDRLLERAPRRSGRGGTARVEVGPGHPLRIKRMRRGGLLEPVWRDRFRGTSRLLRNLSVPAEALARGVPTANPVALLMLSGPPGLHRAWIAFDEIEGAIDLTAVMRSSRPADRDELRTAIGAVRVLHDRGVEHPDLNLGNLMLRRRDGGAEAFVIDLDRGRIHDGALAFAARQRALRRLERSWVKETAREDRTDWIYDGYAGSDADLRARLSGGRRTGRWLTRLHRQGGRR
jgi:tRNA A-37 threonylcarbamoyl transferase component Bud32